MPWRSLTSARGGPVHGTFRLPAGNSQQYIAPIPRRSYIAGVFQPGAQTIDMVSVDLVLLPVAPTLNQQIAPGAIALSLTPVSPTLNQQIQMVALALTLTPVAPTLSVAGGGAQTITMGGALALSLTPVAPQLNQQVQIGVIALSLTPLAPQLNQQLQLGAIALTLTPVAPRLDQQVRIGVLSLTLTPVAPTLSVAAPGSQTITMVAIGLTLVAVPPVVSQPAVPSAPTGIPGGGGGRRPRHETPFRKRRRPEPVVVGHTLMANLTAEYGIPHGREIYFAMEREHKGPFAPGNKYDATLRRMQLAETPHPTVQVRPIKPPPR